MFVLLLIFSFALLSLTKPDTSAAGAGTALHAQDALAAGRDLRHAVRRVRVDPQTEGDGLHPPNVSPVAKIAYAGFAFSKHTGWSWNRRIGEVVGCSR